MDEKWLVMFSVFSTAFLAYADVPVCNGSVAFNPPQNQTTRPTWYPTNFTDSPPLFPKNYNCEYQINVPQLMYAQVTLTVITNSSDGYAPVTVVDQMGRSEEIVNSDNENFYFISSGGKINLSTNSANVQFGFYVIWYNYTRSSPIQLNVSRTDSQPNLLKMDTFHPIQVKADTRATATVMSDFPYSIVAQFLRGIVFFDGPDWNSTCLGTARQLLDGKTQYVSTGNTMTILFIGYENWINFFRFLLQDYELTKGIVQFQSGFSDGRKLLLDASKEPSALQTYADIEMATDVVTQIQGSGVLDVYIGTRTENKTNLIASYQVETYNDRNLPQKFLGQFKTYILTDGIANLTITRNYFVFETTNDFGRKGFISSGQYGTNSSYQSSNTVIESPNRTSIAKFRFTIQKAGLVGSVSLQITGTNGKATVFSKNYTHSHMPTLNLFDEFYGDTFKVDYDGSQKNTGFLMDFEVDKSSSCVGIAIGVALSFFALLW